MKYCIISNYHYKYFTVVVDLLY
eukprot:UN05338